MSCQADRVVPVVPLARYTFHVVVTAIRTVNEQLLVDCQFHGSPKPRITRRSSRGAVAAGIENRATGGTRLINGVLRACVLVLATPIIIGDRWLYPINKRMLVPSLKSSVVAPLKLLGFILA